MGDSIFLASFLIRVVFWLAGFWLLYKVQFCETASSYNPLYRPVSIIIPARNEQHNLALLLDSIQTQKPEPLEVLVVDDNSEDDTAEVARKHGARVISLHKDIVGWMGKSLAAYTGAKAARGDLLLFLDADTWLQPEGLRGILATQQKHKGVISIQPYHRIKKFYENFSLYFNIVLMSSMGVFSPLQDRVKPIGAFGPCLLIDRKTYFQLEGHKHTKDQVLEDLALGKKIIKANIPLTCLGGRGCIHFRMYPQGLVELINGFAKGFAIGAGSTSIINLLLVVLWITGSFFPATAIRQGIATGDWLILAAGIAFYAAYVIQVAWMSRQIGNFSIWAAILYPIFLIFFTIIFLWSLIITLFGKKVNWKNRKVKIK